MISDTLRFPSWGKAECRIGSSWTLPGTSARECSNATPTSNLKPSGPPFKLSRIGHKSARQMGPRQGPMSPNTSPKQGKPKVCRGKLLKTMVGPNGLEPLTSTVSRQRSNRAELRAYLSVTAGRCGHSSRTHELEKNPLFGSLPRDRREVQSTASL